MTLVFTLVSSKAEVCKAVHLLFQKLGPLGNVDSCFKVMLREHDAFKLERSLGGEKSCLLRS